MEFNIVTIKPSMVQSKALILYTRLPDYFYQSLLTFCEIYNFKCDLVRYDQDANTSFDFRENDYITFIDRSDFKPQDFLKKEYKFIYTSTWNDQEYKTVCKSYKASIPVVLGMDNPWLGTWKQKVHSLISGLTVRKYFNYIWVPGEPQVKYARRLGFADSNILKGLYTCDTDKFVYKELNSSAKTILFLGRFVEYKKPHILARLFSEILQEQPNLSNWSLRIVGRGPLLNEIKKFESAVICIEDFVKPEYLPALMHSCTAFCLPSEHEHWGVVVHEAAASGLPLILSDTVYGHTLFLQNGRNGYLFETGSEESLKSALIKLMTCDEEKLRLMGQVSADLAFKLTKQIWANRLYNILSN
jgi:glycosyltransferase involved in cell wall biosynthesis